MSADHKTPGRVVGGRYELLTPLGEGGMGQVFRAVDTRLGRDVTIKLLRPELGKKYHADKRFLREAQVGAKLSHPNLVQTYDFGRDGDDLFLAMELLEGRNLAQFLAVHKTLSEEHVLAVAAQVASGLADAHDKGLVHRDLKPDNIVLVSEEPLRCKVIDFGMAVQSSEHSGPAMERLTVDGSIGGTPRYMAPEQLRGEAPVAASDVYALGCVLHELSVGAPPYDLDALGEVAAHHLYAPIPELRTRRPEFSPVFEELVRRCLGKTPSSRPAMKQVLQRLEDVGGGPARRRHNRRSTIPMRSEFSAPRALYADSETPTESMAPPKVEAPTATPIAVEGALASELYMALAAAGFAPGAPGATAVLGIDLTETEIAELCSRYEVVLVDAAPGDMSRVAHLLRIGVAEVLTKPVLGEKLVSKLRRALRIHSRQTPKEVP